MKKLLLLLLVTLFTSSLFAQAQRVTVAENMQGMTLNVNGKPFMVNGMNWDYFPIGTTVTYSLWNQPDDIIKSALDAEMSLLKNMGVNTVRMYTGVQPKWIQYIYEKYGIYTMLNHAFGRYGLTIDGGWMANTEYADPRVRQLLLAETKALAEDYKNTPGLLLFLLGNENNYGLFWAGAETEDFPDDDAERAFIGEKRGRPMYRLMNDAAIAMKSIDSNHPVAICNGDVLFIDIVAQECKDVDIYGSNTYRGVSFTDLYDVVKQKYGKPVLLTEFGADAFNAVQNQEDQLAQAHYVVGNWKEIYENAAGLGKAGNSLGGFTFQFSDGWWKFGQTTNLDVHDNNASWDNGGYPHDFVEGEDNMNEEWFGICAKGPTNERGLYQLFPRAAYYTLKEAHQFDPYGNGVTLQNVQSHFNKIVLMDGVLKARGDKAALSAETTKKVRISQLRGELTTFYTGGDKISTPEDPAPNEVAYPDELGFDHMQSFYVGVEANPTANFRANATFNILGNVAENPINEIFFENRGRPVIVNTPEGPERLNDVNRFMLYQAEFQWTDDWFNLNGFYRTGHYHWGYEGDFFGLYPEANYGPNLDIYNANAPFGFEFEGKKSLEGLKVAFGPELWWAANPAVLVKYSRRFAGIDFTGIFHEDLDRISGTASSFAIPMPLTRRATLHAKKEMGPFGIEVGGIWGGQPLNGRNFQVVRDIEGKENVVMQDQIGDQDNWGGKVKLTFSKGPINWYAQGAVQGLVANGSPDPTLTFTGWRLKDSGSGNQYNFLTGFTYLVGDLQIAPNFLWQKPIEGPVPGGVDAPGRARNILDDPFAVRGNRETVAGEILFTYDPTPGSYMYQWDNDVMEDSKFAMSAGFVFRHHPTTMDGSVGILADGRTIFAFPDAVPAQDLWEAHARIVNKITPEFGIITNMYGGNAQARGNDPRLIERFGADVRMIYKKMKVRGSVQVNDWGPFDYHRDFNQTYPLQLMLDVSTSLGKQSWFLLPDTRAGVSWIWRSLDQFSPRYCPIFVADVNGGLECDETAPGFDQGQEWEFRTYLHFNIGN
ncbi:MAG: glycoside hydrolase family 2 TIM barrel-domain containing protein [Bacteroidota bacterium]